MQGHLSQKNEMELDREAKAGIILWLESGEVWTWALEDVLFWQRWGRGCFTGMLWMGRSQRAQAESSCVAGAPDLNVGSGIYTRPSQAAISHQELTKSGTSARTTL